MHRAGGNLRPSAQPLPYTNEGNKLIKWQFLVTGVQLAVKTILTVIKFLILAMQRVTFSTYLQMTQSRVENTDVGQKTQNQERLREPETMDHTGIYPTR